MINKEAYIELGIVGEEVQTVKGGVNGRIDFPADGEFSCAHSNIGRNVQALQNQA